MPDGYNRIPIDDDRHISEHPTAAWNPDPTEEAFRAAYHASHPRFIPCSGCVRRGEPRPYPVRRGYVCNDCANIEEGAY